MRAIRDPLVALLCILGVFLAGAAPAAAGPYEDALAGFASDSFTDTGTAIDAVAASGHALAATVLGALQERRLHFSAASKKV